MKKKILLLYNNQFGYHTDTFMYSKYLNKEKYEVHYFCFDFGFPKLEIEKVNVHYIPKFTNRFILYLNFFYQLNCYLRKEKFDLIFQVDDRFSLLVRIINIFQPMILDIRTGDLSTNKFKLFFKNHLITFAAYFYKHCSVISESLGNLLNLKKSTHIIPLGGEIMQVPPKKFDAIKLLYLGSLNKRHIDDTIYGLSLYLERKDAFQDITYDILGFGGDSVISEINEAILKTNLNDKVLFHGRKKIDELRPFFEKCNIGVVYIPQTKWYNYQPATKFYECLLAGMPVIATNTNENKLAVKEGCGVITEDNPLAFADAVEKIIREKESYNSVMIINFFSEFAWNNIVKYNLEPYLDRVINSFRG